MLTLIAHVANCGVGGDETTRQASGAWSRDVIRFRSGRWQFEFRQRPDVAGGRTTYLRGTFVPTTTVTVTGVRRADVSSVLRTLDNMCWLLSFACQSRVMRYAHEYPAGSGLLQQRTVVGCINTFRPPFELVDGSEVRDFIQQSLPTFKTLKRQRRLSVVIDYLAHMDAKEQPLELRLLSIFITLECLKDTFARSRQIPYIKGFYRKPPTKPGKPGAAYSFADLLNLMLRSAGMRRGLKRIIALRNEIIHSGLSRKPHDRQWRMYEHAQDLVREYMLRLLGYRGKYFAYSGRGMQVKRV